MNAKIVLLVKEHFADYCRNTFPFEGHGWVIRTETYDTFEQLAEIYRSLWGKCDAIITSAEIPYHFLRKFSGPEAPVLGCFGHDTENVYRIILQESVRRNHFDLSRIGFDALPLHVTMKQAIDENMLPDCITAMTDDLYVDDLDALQNKEDRRAQYYMEQAKEGKLDYVLSYSYSIVTTLLPLGIDCYYLYPGEKEFRQVVDAVYNRVRLREQEKSAPAVVHLALRPMNAGEVDADLRVSELQTALLEYIKSNQYDVSVKQGSQYFHLYTDVETLGRITGDL